MHPLRAWKVFLLFRHRISFRYQPGPGRRFAYKLGELQIRRHRREAEQKMGPRFDQRHFHDAILDSGRCRCRCWSSGWRSSSPMAA